MMNNEDKAGNVLRLAARGDGVTQDGRFIPGAVPGDLVEADGTIIPGPHHATPPCRHFGSCGGCQLQHLAEPMLGQFARARALEPLARLGIVPEEVMPAHVSPRASRRRAAMRATRRGGHVRVGFNAAGTHELLDIRECPVMREPLFALVEPLRRLLGRHIGERSAIAIAMIETDHGIDLSLSNLQARQLPVIEGLTEFATTHGLARLSVEGPDGPETIVANATPAMAMGGVDVVLPPGAFLQATRDGEAALLAAVEDVTAGARRIADLFAGVGTFALPLSARAEVVAVDGAGAAIRALDGAARRAGRHVTTQHRDLFRRPLSAAELDIFDAVVIDPPRAGAIAQTEQLALSKVPLVAAVSCNPATFARDAERLVGGGYRLRRLWPVAQFRWSTHVELVAEFRR